MTYTVCLSDNPYSAVLTPPVRTLPLRDRVLFALHYAALAPSVHNTQPWRFRIIEDDAVFLAIEVYADPQRDLQALDPAHRQLIISCGASVAALDVGLASLGVRSEVKRLPDGGHGRPVARIVILGDAQKPSVDSPERLLDAHLGRALATRRSYRGRMAAEPSTAQIGELSATVAERGLALVWVSESRERQNLERLVAMAALTQAGTPAIEDEIRDWTSPNPRGRDGIPEANWQRTSKQAAMAPVVQRDFALGRTLSSGVHDSTPPGGPDIEPGLAALCSAGDEPLDWLHTGETLMRLLLRAEGAGLAVGYVNQPVEVPRLRTVLGERLSKVPGWNKDRPVPQLLLRVGRPAEAAPPPTPRRPVSELLLQAQSGRQ